MNKTLILIILAWCSVGTLHAQQLDAYSIHYGNFHSWSPTSSGGLRVTASIPKSPALLNGSQYPKKDSRQNGYFAELKRNGGLVSLDFTMSEGVNSSWARCSETSVLQTGYLTGYDSFVTDKFKYEFRGGYIETSDYMALFKNSSKPELFSIGQSHQQSDQFYGTIYLNNMILDQNDDIYFSFNRSGWFGSKSKKAIYSFGGSFYEEHSFRSGSGKSTSHIGLRKKSNRYNKSMSVHFNKGGRASIWKGVNGPAFIHGYSFDSVLVTGRSNHKYKFPYYSRFLLELDANWKVVNSVVVNGSGITPITTENGQVLFQVGSNDSVKVGDTTLFASSSENSWLVKLKPKSKVEIVSSFANVVHYSIGIVANRTAITTNNYATVMEYGRDTFIIQSKSHFVPLLKNNRWRSYMAAFFDKQHNLVNIIPGAHKVKYGSNGNVYFEQQAEITNHGPKLPDSILSSVGTSGVIVTEISKKFIYSNLITPNFSYCHGERIKVIPMSIEKFDSNNVFTIELSDSNGHFINPTVIGSLKSSSLDTVTGVIPNALGSKHYRVRLVSSSPKHIGLDNAFDVEVKEPVARPNASDSYYCQGETAIQLSPSGNGIRWYSKLSDTTGGGLTIPPTPSTASAGITTYLVTQPDSICGISTRLVDVHVLAPKGSPIISDVYYCKGDSAIVLAPSGKGIRWYTNPADTLNNGLSIPPTPLTTTAGTQTYLVTQYDSVCGDSSAEVKVHIQTPKGLPTISDAHYCKGDSATVLAPSGKDIRWYTNPADTVNKGLGTPPIPPTTTAGTQTYLVTQYDSVCGDSSAEVKVHVQAPYQLPNTVDRNYCVGDTAVALSPSGNGLIWYTNPSDTSGKGTAVPPIPSTLVPGLQNYLISTQHDTVCPVSTKLVKVNVQAPLDTPVITQKDTLLISSLSSNIKWYKNSVAISGATNDTLLHSGNGFYKVVHTDSNGCQSFDTIAIKSVTVQTAITSQFQAYPNPFSQQILVDLEGVHRIKLFNAKGQLVMENHGTRLNTSSIQPGLYHLEVLTQSGEVYRKKMVKY